MIFKTQNKMRTCCKFVIFHKFTSHNFYAYLLTPWSRVLLQRVKKFPTFLEPEGSSPYSQVPATCPYPEKTPSTLHNPLPLPEDPS